VRTHWILAVVLLAAFAIDVETTVVNVALPSINRELGSSTSELQWIVDAYNLSFAALVLAGGTLGDRFGRRRTLAAGLVVFLATSCAAAFCDTSTELIGVRFLMGTAAALIFPTTLSILTATYRERAARARAIGAWGATIGLGVAIGPVAGGALLESWWWGSVFLALVPASLLALLGCLLLVPDTGDPQRPPLDLGGLVLSILFLGCLVYTIIEAPRFGWLVPRTLAGFMFAAAALAMFIVVERRHPTPMMDVTLFTDLRFSAASGSVTAAYFALFGFMFLITQYLQQLRGYSPLDTGIRILPVAAALALGALAGPPLAVRVGNKAVVTAGLLGLAVAFFWFGTIGAVTGYPVLAAQMLLLGTGLGLASAAATESIMGVVHPERAGIGSAVNDATREVGGTLGVAVLGSASSSVYAAHLSSDRLPELSEDQLSTARDSLGGGLAEVQHLLEANLPAARLQDAVTSGFLSGLHTGCLTAAGVCVGGALAAAVLLPAQPGVPIEFQEASGSRRRR
jgi:EmrB/QacA subfamily drug resistance transporter